MKQRRAQPLLSVVLVGDRLETLEPMIARFRDQAEHASLELVLVLPRGAPDDTVGGSLDGFGAIRSVTVDTIVPLGHARAAGVRATTAPIVFLAETHAFPADGFVRAILEAQRGPWAVVVPGFRNANPKRTLSWVGFVSDYGQWLQGLPRRELQAIPTYNAAYRREDLLARDPRLERILSPSDELALSLRANGKRFLFVPSARLEHLNVDIRFRDWASERYLGAVDMASARSAGWSRGRRLLYVAGSPLIPFVLLRRLRPGVTMVRSERALPASFYPLLVLAAIIQTAGEVAGYVVQPPPSLARRITEYEVHKARYASDPV